MERHDDIDEHLEALWHLLENDESDVDSFRRYTKGAFDEDTLNTLKIDDYITLDGDRIKLTGKGYTRAEQIIRRHRLAERLLTDVLGMESGDIETGACEFEHIIAPELVEGICTLLGHPRECPMGEEFPKGNAAGKPEKPYRVQLYLFQRWK